MTSLKDRKNNIENSRILSKIVLADKTAAKECVDVYGGMVWSLARKYTASTEEAEKAVQEIFIDIWQNAKYCDLSMSDEKVWIALIARRRLSKYAVAAEFQPPVKTANNVIQFNRQNKTEVRLPPVV